MDEHQPGQGGSANTPPFPRRPAGSDTPASPPPADPTEVAAGDPGSTSAEPDADPPQASDTPSFSPSAEPTKDGAIGKSYLVYPGVNGRFADEKHQGHDGGYQDKYVKTAQGWRFKERVHVFPPQIPGEYTGTPNTELEAQSAARAGEPAR